MSTSESSPQNPLSQARQGLSGALSALSVLATSQAAGALSKNPIGDETYRKALWNLPSDDFWYPPYLIGRWSASFKFTGAQFTKQVPLETLAQNENLPGFSKYSVIFAPDMGQDISNVTLRWAQIDSHPREDHPFNIRQLVHAFIPDAVVDSAPYFFQKAPTTLRSPANRWSIKYHDASGEGVVDLVTLKRDIKVFADTVETTEYFSQTHTRRNYIGAINQVDESSKAADDVASSPAVGPPTVAMGDYALNWRFKTQSSVRDEFVNVEDLSKTKSLLGNLDVLVYFRPTNDLYFKAPGVPAGIFSYEFTMERIGDPAKETADTVYPFVWRGDGPVELDQYFGY